MRVQTGLAMSILLAAGCFGGPDQPEPVGDPMTGAPTDAPIRGPDPGPAVPGGSWLHRVGGGPIENGTGPDPPLFRLATLPGVWGWEPSVGVDGDGAIYYAAASNTTSGDQVVHVLRSQDGGASWVEITPGLLPPEVPPNRFTNDPYLAVDPVTGRVYAGHMRVECNTLHWSDDAGETWVTNPVACSHPFEDRPLLMPAPLATPAGPLPMARVLYMCSNQAVASTCSRSLDGGATFQATPPPFAGDPTCAPVLTGFLASNGAASPATGSAFVARWTTCGNVAVARTADNGATWSHARLPVGPRGDGCAPDAMLAVDAAGTVFLAFVDSACLPVLAWSQDDGVTWSAPVSIARPGLAQASHLGLAAGAPGKVALSYMGTSDPLDNGSARSWSLHVAILQDATAPGAVVTTADAGGRPLVAGPSAGGAGFGAGLNGVGDFLDIAFDPRTGMVVAAAVDVCKGPCAIPEGQPPQGRAAIAVQVGGRGLA